LKPQGSIIYIFFYNGPTRVPSVVSEILWCDNGKSPNVGDGTQGPDLAITKATVRCLYYVNKENVNDKHCLQCELLCCSAEKRQMSSQPNRRSKIWFHRMFLMSVWIYGLMKKPVNVN